MIQIIKLIILRNQLHRAEKHLAKKKLEKKLLEEACAQLDFWTAEEERLWMAGFDHMAAKNWEKAKATLLQSRTAQLRAIQEIRKVKKPRKETMQSCKRLDGIRNEMLKTISNHLK